MVKKMLSKDPHVPQDWNISDERTFHTPKYFEKKAIWTENGEKNWIYAAKKSSKGDTYLYWEEREKGSWLDAPRIYDDHCQPFY